MSIARIIPDKTQCLNDLKKSIVSKDIKDNMIVRGWPEGSDHSEAPTYEGTCKEVGQLLFEEGKSEAVNADSAVDNVYSAAMGSEGRIDALRAETGAPRYSAYGYEWEFKNWKVLPWPARAYYISAKWDEVGREIIGKDSAGNGITLEKASLAYDALKNPKLFEEINQLDKEIINSLSYRAFPSASYYVPTQWSSKQGREIGGPFKCYLIAEAVLDKMPEEFKNFYKKYISLAEAMSKKGYLPNLKNSDYYEALQYGKDITKDTEEVDQKPEESEVRKHKALLYRALDQEKKFLDSIEAVKFINQKYIYNWNDKLDAEIRNERKLIDSLRKELQTRDDEKILEWTEEDMKPNHNIIEHYCDKIVMKNGMDFLALVKEH